MRFLAGSPTMKLYDADRASRRRIADALEVLRALFGSTSGVESTIRTNPLVLPSGESPFLLQLVCKQAGLTISLPTSHRFHAKLLHERAGAAPEWREFSGEVSLLEGAIVD